MNASLNDHFEHKYYLLLDLFRVAKVMLLTLALMWSVNIFVLISSPTVSTKSTPCFTDGDCPSALDQCVYGSWKGLGNCHRKPRVSARDLRRMVRSDGRNMFGSRRLVRRRRNPSNIWNDSYLSQKRWHVWLPSKQKTEANDGHLYAALPLQTTDKGFDGIASDLLNFGRSYVAFNDVNYTFALLPTEKGAPDWLLTLTRDNREIEQQRTNEISRERLMANAFLQKHEQASTNDQANVASILLENSFGSSGASDISSSDISSDAIVNISFRYPISVAPGHKYTGRNSNIRFRFRRHLPGRLMDSGSIDPLINHVTQIEPVIPMAEDVLSKRIGKRSILSKKEMQRIRRELDDIEDEVAPLPKVIRSPDEGPIIIEELFNKDRKTSTLRKRRHGFENKGSSVNNRMMRHKRHKRKQNARLIRNVGSIRLSSRQEQKRKSQPAFLLRASRKTRSKHTTKHPRITVKRRVRKQSAAKVAKRSYATTGKATRKVAAGSFKEIKRPVVGTSGGNSTHPETTDAPDPFVSIKNTKQPHIDYYDVSKRNQGNDDDDMDPESSLDDETDASADDDDSETSPDDDDPEADSAQEDEPRRKRQTFAEELEDDDEQEIPSWRETMELLRRANTFAVPAHDSSGHLVLVRRVRDLGALDLGESLSKLRETMAKIFGRCSPARRRKRSHRAPPVVVTDQLSNQETWQIQGQGQEVMDQAKIDVHMDDDKPYNVTTVLRPMGKRSYNYDRKNKQTNMQQSKRGLPARTSREMRDILEQNAKLDEIHHSKRLGKSFNRPGLKNSERATRGNGGLAHSKQVEDDIPMNKDIHMEAQKGSPVEINLTVNEGPGAAPPVADVQSSTLSKIQSETALSKRNQHQQSPLARRLSLSKISQSQNRRISRHPSPSFRGSQLSSEKQAVRGNVISKVRRGHREKCTGCKRLSQYAPNMNSGEHIGRKAVREPYIITRRYNDSQTRSARAENGGRKIRQPGDRASLDRANLLYLADGDPLSPSWRAPLASVKRDVDIKLEVESFKNDTENRTTADATTSSTAAPPVTVQIVLEKEDDDNVFAGNLSARSSKRPGSLQASASATSHQKGVMSPVETASFVLGGQVLSDSPARAEVINLSPPRPQSMLAVKSGDIGPAVEETVTSGDPDWGISGSSDRLISLISGIEKALRVPLGGQDTGFDRVTLLDDGSGAVQTQAISSQPEVIEHKNSYTYSVGEPQPPLVIASTTQEKRPGEIKMDVSAGSGEVTTKIGDLHENIYLKGFELPRKPTKPLYVDAAAKKMIWVQPSYKTVVSSGFPKYKQPLGYLRLYNGAVPYIKPVHQWTKITDIKNLNSDTIGNVKTGNGKQITIEKFEDHPLGAAITDIRTSKTSETFQPPKLLDLQKNIVLSGQLLDNASPPERDGDAVVKVVSSVSSDDPNSSKTSLLNTSPAVAVHMDGQKDASGIIESNNFPSDIRILHKGRDSDGKIVATIESQHNLKKKKDLQEFSDASQIPQKHSSILSSNGVVLFEKRLNSGFPSMHMQGDKRNTQHMYRTPYSRNKGSIKRMVNTNTGTVALKRANGSPAQAAPVVHTYSNDPGVQGATVGMMNDLASRMAAQKPQGGTSRTSPLRKVACGAGNGNCRRKRHGLPVRTSAENIPTYEMSPKPQQHLGQNIISARQIRKRDLARTVLGQPKVFIVGPSTIFEAPGTKYKFIDPQERKNATKHLKIYTLSNATLNDAGEGTPVEKPRASGASARGDDHFSYDSASNLPMSHEKALQEADSQERYKIVDSVEVFSVDPPSFAKKITSGGQISEDRMVPVPVEVDRSEFPQDEQKISITAGVGRHRHRPALKLSATGESSSGISPPSRQQTVETVEYLESEDTGPVVHDQPTEVVQVIEGQSSTNTRKKRRSPSSGAGIRQNREAKIQALRKELQNLNNVGEKLGLHFFDESSIDRIVREVSHQGKETIYQRQLKNRVSKETNTKRKRKRKTSQGRINTNEDSTPFSYSRSKSKRNSGNIKTRHTSALGGKHSSLDETDPAKSIEGRGNSKSYSHAKLKRNGQESTGPDSRWNKIGPSQHHIHSKRAIRASNKQQRNVRADIEDNANIEVAPVYHYLNEVKNGDSLEISNPENHDSSNNRQREEKNTISNKESEPMEISAVLRGRRKKREIKPDESSRVSRAEPLYPGLVGNRVAAQSNQFSGQWQKQFASARLHRYSGRTRPDHATSGTQTEGCEPNQRSLSPQNDFNSRRAAVPRRSEPSAISELNSSQVTEKDKRQQILNAFSYRRNFGLQDRQMPKRPQIITQNTDNVDTIGSAVNDIKNEGITIKSANQVSSKPVRTEKNNPKGTASKVSNVTSPDQQVSPQKSKPPEMGVWKKLGEVFDIVPKETLRPDMESTVLPPSSPAPPQATVPGGETGRAAPAPGGRGPGERRPAEQPRPSSETGEDGAKSGLRAAIVDRLLQDLRKMASARGSEMARAESDLIEILHDYQTDLMDDDEQTIAGEPFQGVRIHDNVPIPVVYQAVPIKTESLSQPPHSNGGRSGRASPGRWDPAVPYNPP